MKGLRMSFRLYDAHNHLQDERLAPHREAIRAALQREGVARMVVNGSCEEDWSAVLALARECPQVIPSFGYHPWYVKERTSGWQQALTACLDAIPSAVGEIGLDRWMRDYDLEEQEAVFTWQLRLASERDVPVSIHCLQAWGRLLELLRAGPVPRCGFVLHSFGGPQEMIGPLAELGAFFSLPGYFAHERKSRQRQAFRQVPPERLLVETDAPDQLLPEARVRYPLADPSSGRPINHPANLVVVYEFAAELFQEPLDTLSRRVEENFLRLFGRLRSPGRP
jgi:TatD DNase family protein